MGRIRLHRLLSAGIIAILFLSFLFSAMGVSAMVRRYFWRTGIEELQSFARPVERFLSEPGARGLPGEANNSRRANLGRDRLSRGAGRRGLRRFNRGRDELFLLHSGKILKQSDESEESWGEGFAGLDPGVHLLELNGELYQVLSRNVSNKEYDQFVITRPWSPFIKTVRALVGYQVLTMTLVLALAILAVRALVRRIVVPLEELRDWSERIGESKIEALSESKIEEVAALQNSFSQMGHRVDEALAAHRRFVADASHELKTPLTAISGMLELLESRPEMSLEDRKQAVGVAKTEAGRMETLVSDLLVLSRAQARRSGERETSLLASMVEEQLVTLRLLFPGQQFDSELEGETAWSVNPQAFARIVRNLVENAARHAGGKPISVRLEGRPEGARLEVIDQGPGIAADKLPQLFQRFYRTDEGRSRDQGGFGLGLAIVEALAEEADGELTCRSAVGEGTTFCVDFKKSSGILKYDFKEPG